MQKIVSPWIFQWQKRQITCLYVMGLGNLCLLTLFVAVIIQMIKSHVSEKYDEKGTLLSFFYCHFIVS